MSSLIINTNISAMNAHRYLVQNDSALTHVLGQLSSGLRINTAADDAAGLAISQKLNAQVLGLNQATSNAQDATNMLQTVDGAQSQTESILQRMRQLAVQGANDTLSASDRSNITTEMTQLSAEVDQIASTTQFNGVTLLNGGSASTSGFTFQVGANAGQYMNVSIATANAAALGVLTTQLSVDTAANASTTISNIDAALSTLNTNRATMGADINRLGHVISNLQVQSQNLSASESQITDLDMAAAASQLTRGQILTQASQAMLAQANQAPQGVLRLLG